MEISQRSASVAAFQLGRWRSSSTDASSSFSSIARSRSPANRAISPAPTRASARPALRELVAAASAASPQSRTSAEVPVRDEERVRSRRGSDRRRRAPERRARTTRRRERSRSPGRGRPTPRSRRRCGAAARSPPRARPCRRGAAAGQPPHSDGVEPLGRELADRLEHRVALRREAQEALLDERLERVDVRVGDGLGRVERAAAREDREAAEEPLLVGRRAGRRTTRSSREASAGEARRRARP